MKQENGKKSKLWLWIALAAVAVLVAVGVVLAIFLQPADPNEDSQGGEKPVSEVYWNIDRVKFTENAEVAGLSERTKSEDGLFHFRMASQGKLLDMATKDRKLVNYMDTMDVMGLVLDADGLVIDALDVKTIAVETAINYYVKAINGNTVTINSSVAMNGMDMIIELTDSTYIMDVRAGTETPGQSLALDVLDLVAVYGSEEVPAEAIYLLERTEASPLYLRVDQFYDSENVTTTRVPDKNGVYTIPFAINGKVEQLKCKDKGVVTGIDSGNDSNKVMGLTFDEEGYITGTIGAAAAVRGKLVANVYHVTAVDGNAIEATRLMSGSEQGKVANFTLTENTQIIMDEDGCGHFIGERVSGLQLNDSIIAWTDMGTDALYVLVTNRLVDFPMYYSYNPHGINAEGETSRSPDANGYYIFELATQGKCITAKTKDKALASKIDSASYSCQYFGLNVERGIIKEFYPVQCITGTRYGIGGATRFVTQVIGPVVQITANDIFTNVTNYMMTAETEVYDVSEYAGSKIGSKTTLQPGDRVVAARDPMNNLTHVYVLDRYYKGCKLYYNEQRDTERAPNAEGYYVYTVYCEGKKMEVKTKDKEIATAIDAQNAPIVAMKVSNGIVKAAYPAIAASMYSAKRFNFNYVSAIARDKTVSCYTFSNGQRVEVANSYKMAKNCQIYNVSTNFSDHRGEKATLKVGDRIQAIQNYETGELTHIWIMGRAMDAPLYMHYKRVNLSNGVTKRTPNAEGYYEVQLFVDGEIKTFRTKNRDLMSQIDGYDEETFFTMETDGDIILKADVASSSIYGMNLVASQSDVMKISGKNITTIRMRPGAGNYGETVNFTINNKTKIYNVSYYAGEERWKEAKLELGDRVIVYGDRDGNISYIFIVYPHLREKGYESKCPHCNKVVWWEPWTGGAISNLDVVHYYQPADYTRNQGTIGKDPATNPDALRYTIVFDMNGKTMTSNNRNFLVYSDLVLIDSVGGGVLEASGGGEGGNILVSGGTLTICDGITLRKSGIFGASASEGGNIAVSNNSDSGTTGKVILQDAKLEGWDCFDGGSILLNAGTELTINKATVTGGDIHVAKGAKVKLNGSNIQILDEGIILDAGAKITESKLSGKSKVIVQASGIFTEKLSNVNEQKAYYEAERKYYPVEVRNGALWSDRDPSKPDYMAEPAIPAKPALLKTDNSPLTLDAKNQAKCPVCNEVVTWTAITDTSKVYTLVNGNHYYLAKDLTFEKADVPFIQVAEGQSACLHLNDHNITATKAMAILVNGTLNVMGNGTVSGCGYADGVLTGNDKPTLHAATLEVASSNAVINLYGGTYVKSAANTTTAVVEIYGGGGVINMFEGTVIDARGTNKNAVQSYWGMFNLYGGTIYGGETDAVWAGNWTDTRSGGFSIYGGTVQSDANKAIFAGGVTNGPATLGIYGGKVNGNTRWNANAKIVIAGNPKLTSMTQPESKEGVYEGKIILGKLTDGAEFYVNGTGEITFPNENAGSYLKYFGSLTDEDIAVINHAISFVAPDPGQIGDPTKPAHMKVDNSPLVLENNQAKCPVCEKMVTWTAITDTSIVYSLVKNGHYYLPNDLTFEQADGPFIKIENGRKACLHLNGHNITATNAMAIQASRGILNIMGNGTVSGNGSDGVHAATLETWNSNAVVNLYGGTYVKAAANEKSAVVEIHGDGGTINMLEGAVIDARGTSKNAVQIYWGMFNLYGGTVYGGQTDAIWAGNWSDTKSGSVSIYGGTVQSDADKAVNINGSSEAPSVLNLYGGQINGNTKFTANDKITVAGNPKLTSLTQPENKTGAYEGKITLGELTDGAYIPVMGTQEITFANENAGSYLKYFVSMTDADLAVKNNVICFVMPENPADPTKPAHMKVDNSPLVLENNQAKCPVCEKVVTWTAITDTSATQSLESKHYYLPNDLTFEQADGPFIKIENGKKACLHLNGHNITATNAMAIQAGRGILNIMGNGTVSGNGSSSLHAATLEAWNASAVVNLYGGTYVKSAANSTNAVVEIHGDGGTINMLEGAVIDARGTSKNAVQGFYGMFNLYGGTVYGGQTDAIWAGNWSDTKSGSVSIYGGTVQSDADKAVNINGGSQAPAVLNIYGGQINGNTKFTANDKITVAGNPKLTSLTQPENKTGAYEGKITLGELTEGAEIKVTGTQEITFANENAGSYLKYFVSLTGVELVVKNNAISFYYESDPVLPQVPAVMPAVTEDLQFIENSNWALCPLCKKYVKWSPVTQGTYGSKQLNDGNPLSDGMHFYLAEDIVYSGTSDFMIAPGTNGTDVACFHLNGHNIRGSGAAIAQGSVGTLNILGTGTVSGNGSLGATITIDADKDSGGVFLHSGTYTKASSNENGVVQVNANGGRIQVNKDATIVTEHGQRAAKVAGGNMTNGFLIIGGTVKGGYVESAPLTVKPGLNCEVVLGIINADLQGGAKIAKDTTLSLYGETKIKGLDMTSGAKIAESQLSGTAKVIVKANGIFTEKLSDINGQKVYYEAASVCYPIEVREDALWTDRDATKPDFVDEPAIPDLPKIMSVDNTALALVNNQAKCPVCDKIVTWTAITDASAGMSLENGVHYYLPDDLTFEQADGPFIKIENGRKACLHLNGHKLTATNAMVIQASRGTLNIMGNGTVSGNGSSSLHAATLEVWNASAVVNIYGGTYEKYDKGNGNPVVEIHGDGGTINMFEGAVIDARDTSKNAVQGFYGMFNLYGGTVYGGQTDAIWAGHWSGSKAGGVSIYGGTVQSDANKAINISGGSEGPSTLNLYGGQINGNTKFTANDKVTIAGNPKVTSLEVKEGVKLTLGTMTNGAEIKVTGTGAITFPNVNAESYLNYFKPLTNGAKIVVRNYAINIKLPDPGIPTVPAKPALLQVDNSALTLDNNQAKCPVCDKVVTWTAITDNSTNMSLADGVHYYLPDDLEYTNATSYFIEIRNGRKACLHLNGHKLTATNAMVIQASSGTLNIMGNGTVSGNGSSSLHAATLEAWNASAVVNIYGGTYEKYDKNNGNPVVEIHGDGGTINMFEGAVIDARDTSKNAVQGFYGMFNLYGGTVYGGQTDAIWAGHWSGSKAGGVSIYGGTVQSDANKAINISGGSEGPSTLNLYGGQINGNTKFTANDKVTIAGNPKVTSLEVKEGVMLTLGEMTDGASVTVQANGVFTTQNSDAAYYVEQGYFVPHADYKDITVVGNALSTEKKSVTTP